MLQAMKPSIRSSLWIRGIPQRKFRRAIRAIRLRTLREILGRPPRQRPRDRYFHIADQPLRRQRKTVYGWTMTRLLRQSDHRATARSKTGVQSGGSRGDEFGCASARRFDGAARSIPKAARNGFGIRFGRPRPLHLSASP